MKLVTCDNLQGRNSTLLTSLPYYYFCGVFHGYCFQMGIEKLAFVTGAGSGLGRATCLALAREKAVIVAADANIKTAKETVNLITKESKQNHLAVEVQVESSKSVREALAQVLQNYITPPSVIVNSAGILRDNFLTKLSEEDFDEVLAINLKGTFLVTQIFANAIIEHQIKNGSIINIGSIVGKYGNLGQANYTASKAGVELLSKTASQELGKFGIRVNTILPGMIWTPMLQSVPEKGDAPIAVGAANNKYFTDYWRF
ncbi:(3R)-3-hydroxyacyl-CoA dehydrogenase isoform X2 [Cylas formicarius]|uniref:(3R)-3-hydroxyacyl-CoA dehydrogenase isoform X2 n=1 Tax=Cylas formicarius TaxID=197179 RepID=UPI002958CC45|nr:(3R)-3-hydroxyacyl-CoA dehydrogenase isoform X2 [Cylas formicarius]